MNVGRFISAYAQAGAAFVIVLLAKAHSTNITSKAVTAALILRWARKRTKKALFFRKFNLWLLEFLGEAIRSSFRHRRANSRVVQVVKGRDKRCRIWGGRGKSLSISSCRMNEAN